MTFEELRNKGAVVVLVCVGAAIVSLVLHDKDDKQLGEKTARAIADACSEPCFLASDYEVTDTQVLGGSVENNGIAHLPQQTRAIGRDIDPWESIDTVLPRSIGVEVDPEAYLAGGSQIEQYGEVLDPTDTYRASASGKSIGRELDPEDQFVKWQGDAKANLGKSKMP